MANLANCCLLLLPCRITRLRRATYPNPKFAEHMCVPQTHLGGTSRCFAHPKMSRGACQCATGALAAGVVMLRDFRVGDRDFAN